MSVRPRHKKVPPQSIDCQKIKQNNKTPTASGTRNLFLICWSRESKIPPKTTQAIAVALCGLPEVEGKSLLLKTPYILNTGLGGSKINLT